MDKNEGVRIMFGVIGVLGALLFLNFIIDPIVAGHADPSFGITPDNVHLVNTLFRFVSASFMFIGAYGFWECSGRRIYLFLRAVWLTSIVVIIGSISMFVIITR